MAKRSKSEPVELPVAEEGEITQTTIFPTIGAMWEDMHRLSWFDKYSSDTRRTMKFMFYTAIAETLRTLSFRMNADQSDAVFGEFDAELRMYDRELQAAAAEHETLQ